MCDRICVCSVQVRLLVEMCSPSFFSVLLELVDGWVDREWIVRHGVLEVEVLVFGRKWSVRLGVLGNYVGL